jgi:acyl-CoA thioesterase FadM
MPRAKIALPDRFDFSCPIAVSITDLNYGGHVSNDAFLRYAHEARVRFLGELGASEQDLFGVGIILADAVCVFKSQVFHPETLDVDLAVGEWGRSGFEFVYRVTKRSDGAEAARMKTGAACFDYATNRLSKVPDALRLRFERG